MHDPFSIEIPYKPLSDPSVDGPGPTESDLVGNILFIFNADARKAIEFACLHEEWNMDLIHRGLEKVDLVCAWREDNSIVIARQDNDIEVYYAMKDKAEHGTAASMRRDDPKWAPGGDDR